MPDSAGTYYTASCIINDLPGDALSAVDVSTGDGREELHSYVDEMIDADASSISIEKQP